MVAAAKPKAKANKPMDNDTPYPFLPDFERSLVVHLCTTRKLYNLLGVHLRSECFVNPSAKVLVKAAQSVAKDIGTGPDSFVIVLQRVRTWHEAGRVSFDEMSEISAYIDECNSEVVPAWEGMVPDVKAEVRKRAEWEALQTGLTAYSHHGDVTAIAPQLEKAKGIGVVDTCQGNVVGDATIKLLEEVNAARKFQFGILELDDYFGGGPMHGTLTTFVGNTGGGKSMALVGVACAGAYQNMLVCVATLELPEAMWNARVISSLTDIPSNDILANPCIAQERLYAVTTAEGFGKIETKAFTPKATSVGNIIEWVKSVEAKCGRECDVLIVDYADKISSKGATSDYQEAGNVYDALFSWARDHQRWCFTASASKRKDKSRAGKAARLDVDDLADSQNKARSSDIVICINPEEAGIVLSIAKNRYGQSGGIVGPFTPDFSISRIAPTSYCSKCT